MWEKSTVEVGDIKFSFGFKNHLSIKLAETIAKLLRQTGLPIPSHIAFCMDGNRRFAKKLNMSEGTGHVAGFESMMRVLLGCSRLGIKTATVYAFSIENFNRSPEESHILFGLVRSKLWTMVQDRDSAMHKLDWKIRFPGHRTMLQGDLIERMDEIERITENCKGMLVNICAPYTTRDDLVMAVANCSMDDVPISYRNFEKARHMGSYESLDIFVRTSGETRLSDFMTWEIESSCMIEFVPQLWPEFSVWNLYHIIAKWQVHTLQQQYTMKSLNDLAPAPPHVSVSEQVLRKTK